MQMSVGWLVCLSVGVTLYLFSLEGGSGKVIEASGKVIESSGKVRKGHRRFREVQLMKLKEQIELNKY